MRLDLIRVGQSDSGTFGVLRFGEVPFAVTLERPWENNERKLSCIPTGFYVCQRVTSPRFGEVFEVTGVPGRDHILFHRGNKLFDTEGCILVAEEFGGSLLHPVVCSSERGYTEFMLMLYGHSQFDLCITHAQVPTLLPPREV